MQTRDGARRRGRDRLVSKHSVFGHEMSTMTGGPLRRLQELAAELRKGPGLVWRAPKEANLRAARQSAIKYEHYDRTARFASSV
jgi:hypothetical protein